MPNAKPVLLEPIGKVIVTCPEEYTGNVMGDFTKRRGMIINMDMNDDGEQVIEAEVPIANMQTYQNELRAMTQGRGSYEMEFERYQIAPNDVSEKVIASRKTE